MKVVTLHLRINKNQNHLHLLEIKRYMRYMDTTTSADQTGITLQFKKKGAGNANATQKM